MAAAYVLDCVSASSKEIARSYTIQGDVPTGFASNC
jgi:hypothetical protein